MNDLGNKIRHLVDETAPPIDPARILQTRARRSLRPGWAVGVGFGLVVLAIGLVTFAVLRWGSGHEPAVRPSSVTTGVSETTIDTTPSTTSAAQAEAEARAQEEARRRAALEAARRAIAEQTPYLGLSAPGWEFHTAGEARGGCPHEEPLVGARQATYVASGTAERRLNVNVISRWARCSSEEFATTASELGPPAAPPDVIDHGMTTVMGQEARIIEERGVYSVLWLLDDQGSYAGIVVFPGATPLSVEEVIAISQRVIELTADQWQALVAATPPSVTTTAP